MKKLGWLAALLLLMFPLASSAAGDVELLPPDSFAKCWVRAEKAKVYEGEGVYDHIDGGGELFLELGFEACTVQKYRCGKAEMTFEVYRMADSAAALGIYLMSCGKETPDPVLKERHTVGQNQILLCKGCYYIKGTCQEAGPMVRHVLLASSAIAASKVAPGSQPECLSMLPADGLVEGSVRIIRGPIGLQAFVTLGEGNILGLGPKATAVAGDYEKGGERHTEVVAAYGAPETAKQAFVHLKEKLDPIYKVSESTGDRLVFAYPSGKWGEARLEGNKLSLHLDLQKKPM